jgi:hypothetical protein
MRSRAIAGVDVRGRRLFLSVAAASYRGDAMRAYFDFDADDSHR